MVKVGESFTIISSDTKTYHQCLKENQRNRASFVSGCKHNWSKYCCIHCYSTNFVNNARIYLSQVTTIKEKHIHTQVRAYCRSDGWKPCRKHNKLIATFQSYSEGNGSRGCNADKLPKRWLERTTWFQSKEKRPKKNDIEPTKELEEGVKPLKEVFYKEKLDESQVDVFINEFEFWKTIRILSWIKDLHTILNRKRNKQVH